MRAVHLVTGRGVPLDRSDIDTDQIIPGDWLKRIERTGFGAGLFADWRDDRNFVLNDEKFVGATVLVAGPNFGTGSSREHAVWALQDYGFQAVISLGFGDIFYNNCCNAGLLPVPVDMPVDRHLLDAIVSNPTLEITIDVGAGSVEVPAAGICEPFRIDEFTRNRFMNGWDDIELSLRYASEISEYESRRPNWLPRVPQRTKTNIRVK